jgi:hypothetical protein
VGLSIALAGGGGGGVASAPAGISCAAAGATGCTASFAPGTSVALTATPDANSTFVGWSGGGCTGAAGCAVTLAEAQTVTATFARRPVALTVTLSGPGAGAVLVTGTGVSNGSCTLAAGQASTSCVVAAEAGRAITVNAQPAANNRAGAWSGAAGCAGSAAQACTLTPAADGTVGVSFDLPPVADTLSVTAVSTPPGLELAGTFRVTGYFNGRPTTSLVQFGLTTSTPVAGIAVDPASPVLIEFDPNAQARMVGWGGACAGGATATVEPTGRSSCSFTSTRDTRVTITLAPR